MAKTKLDPDALWIFLDAGHTQAEAARHFGVSEAAIHQRLKHLGLPTSRAVRAVVTTEPIPEARRPDPARLRAIIEARLTWATDVARREGADLVHTIHQFAADVRQDLALHLPIHPADAPDALGTTRENHT